MRRILVSLVALVAVAGCAQPQETTTPDDTAGPATSAAAPTSAPPVPTDPPSTRLPQETPTASAPSGSPTEPAAPTPSVVPANPASSAPPTAPVAENLRVGSEGPEVVALQKRLNELGFWVGPEDGSYGEQTRQAVIAAQKAGGIPTDGWVGPITANALAKGITLQPRTTSGKVLEVDKPRQLLLVVEDGRVVRYYNTSTGGDYTYWNPGSGKYESANTPSGSFTVFREVDGWDPGYLGAIYRPRYFNGGIAVHGTSHDVTDQPESHGCIRLTLPMMDEIIASGQIDVGTSVLVY